LGKTDEVTTVLDQGYLTLTLTLFTLLTLINTVGLFSVCPLIDILALIWYGGNFFGFTETLYLYLYV